MMVEFEGVVEKLNFKNEKISRRWSILVNGDWLTCEEENHPNEGDFVKGFFETNVWKDKIFKNIISWGIKKFEPVVRADRELLIIRQSCLKASVELVIACKDDRLTFNEVEVLVLQTADKFVEWVQNGSKSF